MPASMEVAERRARLATRHRLAPGTAADSVADLTRSLVGLHSSDPVTVYLSALRRLVDPSVDAVGAALYESRSVVRHHAMRRTLWVVTPAVAPVVHASSTTALVGPDRRRTAQWMVASEFSVDIAAADRWMDDAIVELGAELARRDEATTRELGDALPHLATRVEIAPGKPYGGTMSLHTRLLTLMGLMGSIVRTRPVGTWISGQYRWAPTEAWLGAAWPTLDVAEARATVVDAYLRSFGPATTVDVQWWTGWTKGATTKALADAAAVAVQVDDGDAWVAIGDDGPTEPPEPWVALLPGLDPTTMGWKQRAWFLPPEMTPSLFDTNGNAGPTIWVNGRVVGAWAQRSDGTIATRILEPIGPTERRLLSGEAERLRALVGDVRFSVRFASPLGRELARQ